MDTKKKQIKKRCAHTHTIQKCHWKRRSLWILASFWFFIHSRAYLLNFEFIKPFDFNVFVVCGFFFERRRRRKKLSSFQCICLKIRHSQPPTLVSWYIFFCSFPLVNSSPSQVRCQKICDFYHLKSTNLQMKLIEKPFERIEQSKINRNRYTRKWSGQTSFIFHLWMAATDTHEQSV